MAKTHRKYQPSHRINPVVLAKKIEDQGERILSLQRHLQTVIKSNNSHMDYIANFARHDLGNAIQNISAIIRLIENEIAPEIAESLKASVKHLDSTLGNLGEIIHSDPDKPFPLSRLMTAVNVFVRSSLAADDISIVTNYDLDDKRMIHQPFQTLLQLLHNLIINAKKAINANEVSDKSLKRIEIDANIIDDSCVIAVKDTGCGIPDENLDKIFKFGFTTTSGSGIGLYHAKNVCKEIGGDLFIRRNCDGFSTIFIINFPIDDNEKNSCD
ncbi:MAG: HAMP domain-containing histidine kinase [Muribaculaceae bacterium]|nr:HAMP domain-containing histidine kinase [Muribaculaceae bacterium]